MKIIYNSEHDTKEFDLERYWKSLNRYGKVSREEIEEAVSKITYDPCHYTVLNELAVQLLPTDLVAKEYWEDHKSNNEVGFDRLRRITGRGKC